MKKFKNCGICGLKIQGETEYCVWLPDAENCQHPHGLCNACLEKYKDELKLIPDQFFDNIDNKTEIIFDLMVTATSYGVDIERLLRVATSKKIVEANQTV